MSTLTIKKQLTNTGQTLSAALNPTSAFALIHIYKYRGRGLTIFNIQ